MVRIRVPVMWRIMRRIPTTMLAGVRTAVYAMGWVPEVMGWGTITILIRIVVIVGVSTLGFAGRANIRASSH